MTNTTPVISNTQPTETGDHPNNKEKEGWTQVTRGKKKSPSKTPKSSPAKTGKNKNTEEGENHRKFKNGKKSRKPDHKNREKKKEKTNEINVPHEEKEGQRIFYYRRRGGQKKQFKNQNIPTKTIPQQKQRPAQIIPPPQQPKIPQHTLLLNTTSTITHLNPQATLPVPFGNKRLNITIIIIIDH